MIRILFLSLFVLLAGCSSGGGSSTNNTGSGRASLSVSADVEQLRFNLGLYQAQETRVTVRFVGDAVIAGVPVGQTQPEWLGAYEVSQSAGVAVFQIGAYGHAAGTYTGTIRFVTGWIETEEIKYIDVPVTMIVQEPPGIAIQAPGPIVIDNLTEESDLSFSFSVIPDDTSVTWDVVASSSLLHASKNESENRVDIMIDKNALTTIENGTREEWIDIGYSHITYEQSVRVPVTIEIAYARLQYVTPRVIYAGEDTIVRVRGSNVGELGASGILVGDLTLTDTSRVNASEVELMIPGNLPVGEYEISLLDAPPVMHQSTKIIVKEHAVYPTESLTLPDLPQQIIYDPERERFYFTSNSAVYALQHTDVNWEWSLFPIAHSYGIGLSQDGKKLLVGTYECDLWEIDMETSGISIPSPYSKCFYEYFGFIAPLYTGLTIVANTNQWPDMWTYPDWRVPFDAPDEYAPFGITSLYGTHMIWAGTPSTSGPRKAFVFSARDNTFLTLGTLAGDAYLDSLFSISANGNRISHYDDIYNGQLAYIGSLSNGADDGLNSVGISPKGSLAAMFEGNTKMLRIFDISGQAPFPELDYGFMLPEETSAVSRIMFSEDDRYMFVFANNANTNLNKMYVYELD